jgi:hypothetical protein
MHFIYRAGLFLLCSGLAQTSMAQTTSQTAFGKNRVQYNRQIDGWLYYESANFITYWYGDARNVAQAALQTGEYDFAAIQQLLEHQGTEKFEMLVFSDLSDLKQSNIGSDDIFQLRAGETKVVGNKVFVYFDGNHQHLRSQIREGMAGVLINSMLFGSNLQEIVQNAVLLNLPGWYTNGLSAYCGEAWTAENDEVLRNLLLSEQYETFDELAKDHPRLAGHAFWNYISLHFGSSTVSNLLYLTRINRSVDAGFLYVLGGGYRRTTDAMMQYFTKRYQNERSNTFDPEPATRIAVKNKRQYPLSQMRLSPDGKRMAWVRNDIGKWKVYVQDIQTGKRQKVFKKGVRNPQQTTDYNYPLLAWNPDNERLAILYERRDVARMALMTPGSKRGKEDNILSPEYQRVYSMDFVNPADMVFSAEVKGFSDLFQYNITNRQTQRLTNDFWDDLDASVVRLDGKRGVLFASNRLNDTLQTGQQRIDSLLPLGSFDLFFYNLEDRSQELVRITNTPLADERSPAAIDSTYFMYVSNQSGIYNRQVGYMEPYIAYYQDVIYLKDGAAVKALNTRQRGEWPEQRVLAFLAPTDTVLLQIDSTQIDSIVTEAVYKKKPVTWNQTNYSYSVSELHSAPRVGKLLEHFRINGEDRFYASSIDTVTQKAARYTRLRELELMQNGMPIPLFTQDDLQRGKLSLLPVASDTSIGATLRNGSDTLQPGKLFRVPDYLLAPAPPRPDNEKPAEKPQSPPVEKAAAAAATSPKQKPVEFGKYNATMRFNTARIVPYRLKFRTDYVSTTIDNNLLFDGLDSYAASPDGFRTPPPGVLIKANFKDLLENYVLETGFRLPTTFNGAEFYVFLDDKKRRWDKRYALYRKTVVNNIDSQSPAVQEPTQVRTNTVLGQFELRYPIDPFFSLRGRATLRQDKAVVQSTDRVSLETPDYSEQRAALRLSAVYDNTLDVELNIKNGTRALFFVEAVKRFALNTQPNWTLELNDGYMTVIGLDARHYQRLDKRSILAFRLAGATSFGSERILYFLGGIDNWLFPKFNNNIPIPPFGDGFAFQTLASNLRGFEQNIRNGNSYALMNTELRVPIFKYLSQKPVLGSFWRNFQLVGFFDAGTAWQGNDPYSGDNPLNTVVVENPPTVKVTVNYFRDPLVAGYGFGVRSMLFGIHVRADYAWGIETRVIQKPIFYLGIGTDF